MDEGVREGVRWGVTLIGVSASDSSPPAGGRETEKTLLIIFVVIVAPHYISNWLL